MFESYNRPEPDDPYPDQGPKRYPVWTAIWATLVLSFIGIPLVGVSITERDTQTREIGGGIGLFLSAIIFWFWRRVWVAHRKVQSLPEIEDVLRARLDFEPTAFGGIYVAAFFHPPAAAPGEFSSLLVFLQNTNTRRRGVRVKVGPNSELGRKRETDFRLNLSAGEATVLRMPARIIDAPLRDLACLTVSCKYDESAGRGGQFRFTRGIKHLTFDPNAVSSRVANLEALLDIDRTREVPAMTTPEAERPMSQYFSIYAPHRGEPDIKLVERITETPGNRRIPTAFAAAPSGASPQLR